ncbi:uncharacterized protein FIESC28_10825 [Fusarium coffeatum]|uniref:Uncharacterized protein n=1 Tax=Fusarium coffeatum TaxID=231269 RepID=A0A366QQ83_9HYPO|nr:uncharacterized protein FIESC28_10825 [Fusarium coffeatum]RBR07079.1 hypothetical protein FIESC28_10825 [Fusarium coffeatum]
MATTASSQNNQPANSENTKSRLDNQRTQQDNVYQEDQQDLADEILILARSLRNAPPTDAQTRTLALAKQPRFGDLSRYSISNEDENSLWEIEAARLIDNLKAAPETFNPDCSSTMLSAIDTAGFTYLEKLSDQMLCALSMCGLDDSSVLETHCSAAASPNGSIVGRSFKKLEDESRYRPETYQVRGVPMSSVPHKAIWSGQVPQTVPPPMVTLDDVDAVTYYLLVDYITATLARILLTGFNRHQLYWLGIVVTVLAKFSTKLKALSHNLHEFLLETLITYDNLRKCPDLHKFYAGDNLSDVDLNIRIATIKLTIGSSDSYLADYVSDMGVVSNWLFRLLWHILTDMKTRNTRGRTTDEFEISATVFSAGSRGVSTLVYQNRPGHISGSSSSVAVAMYHRAFEIMMDTAASIKKERTQAVQIEQVAQCTLSIGAGKSFPDQSFKIRSMADLISIMVIFSSVDPTLIEDMVPVCDTIRASTVLPVIYSTVKCHASFASLKTIPPQVNRTILQDSRPLSESFILHSGNRILSGFRDRQTIPWNWSSNAITQKELHTSESMRRRISTSARRWAVEDQAISVSCLGYTITVLTGCAILVLGGLMAGFFVGSRIDGVDPFNLTMFSWIVAAFIIVVCKSLRVAEWTWRDFLKGRVTCRSVHELASVTNLDEQGIIMHLLSSEHELPLKLRGPYNGVFAKTGSEGFSVDIKPKMGTLFVSGLVILEVMMESGSALVCLDLRPQNITNDRERDDATGRRRIVHGQREACLVLACRIPRQEGEIERDITFRWQWLSWEKVTGLYNNPNQNVR